MRTGWNVTIRGFIAVDPNDPDTVVRAAGFLKRLQNGALDDFKLEALVVDATFINKRDLPKPLRRGVGGAAVPNPPPHE